MFFLLFSWKRHNSFVGNIFNWWFLCVDLVWLKAYLFEMSNTHPLLFYLPKVGVTERCVSSLAPSLFGFGVWVITLLASLRIRFYNDFCRCNIPSSKQILAFKNFNWSFFFGYYENVFKMFIVMEAWFHFQRILNTQVLSGMISVNINVSSIL